MGKICGIYKITSPSGRIYIGQSIDIKKRFSAYKNLKNNNQTLLERSFIKYKIENHLFEIIHECPKHELNDLEIYYIKLFYSFNSKTGLNLKAGGQSGGVCSEEVKDKLRKPKPDWVKEKLRIAALKRPPVSEETKEKHRQRMIGNKNLLGIRRTGYKHTEEAKAIIKEKRKYQVMRKGYKRPDTSERWKTLNKEIRERGGFDNAIQLKSIRIICILKSGEEINFKSISFAGRELHICPKNITDLINTGLAHNKTGNKFKLKT